MSDKLLPHSVDAERATLGSCFLDREAIGALAGWLEPEHFYTEVHRWIYEAQLACYNRRVPPDLTTVADELRRAGRLQHIGGVPGLIDLSNSVPTSYHVVYYAKIVERTAVLRRLIQAGGKIAALGFDETDDVDAALDEAEQELFRVSQRRNVKSYAPIASAVDRYYEYMEAVKEDPAHANRGLPTGFIDLDRVFKMRGGDFIILAGRPGTGKTSCVMSIVDYLTMVRRVPVGVFELEMSRDQLLQRQIAGHARVDLQRVQVADFSTDEDIRVLDALGRIHAAPLYVDDTGALSGNQLRAAARRMVAEHGVQLLVIDYLQLMGNSHDPRDKRRIENRQQEVSDISRGIKQLARELNIPIIALSQLSRAVEGRQSHVPVLADLRESGSLEQDADVVMFVYREELYDKDTDKKGIADIHIAKHRNGPLDVVSLFFDQRTTAFRNLAPEAESPEGY